MSSLVQPSEMVEVRVEIQGHGMYVPGEKLTAAVSFTNEGALAATVAWAGAQLHCQLLCREGVVKVDLDSLNPASPGTDTAFVPNRGEKGHTILSTPTTVLFCNLSLQPGETKTVMYSEQVPLGGPPSFSGRLVKYTYKLAVGAQKPGCAAQITRIPFHVMTIPENLYKKNIVPSPKSTNPFLTSEVKEDPSSPDIALQALAMETSKRTSMNYTLKNPSGIIGRISLFKPSYKLGEDVTGSFDLSMATVPCVQFAAELHSIEEVPEKLLTSGHPHRPVHSTHARYSECCHNVLQTHFSLPVPLSATQTFDTNCVTVKWQIHFEFVINRSQPKKPAHSENSVPTGSSKATLWQLLNHSSMDTMTWDLPIVILPTLPSQTDERTITHSITI